MLRRVTRGRQDATARRVTLPRPVYPRSAYMVTRRCTQRQFLLRPDRDTNNAFIYCLAVAAKRYDIAVCNFVQMSNHLHDGIYDRHGTAPAFYEHFHKLLAKCVNVIRGRRENVFASGQTSVVRLETQDAFIDKLVYIATNPVNDGLVERVEDWPGASGYRALLDGKPLHARRPRHFFAEDGDMPQEISLDLTIPPELGDRATVLEAVRVRVAAVEQEQARKRRAAGLTVLGRYAILRQSWRDSPTSREPRRGIRPMIAARNLWARLEAIQRQRDFIAAYRKARRDLLDGKPTPFPHGTYWLRRFVGVAVAPAEQNS
jgi:putative transposase